MIPLTKPMISFQDTRAFVPNTCMTQLKMISIWVKYEMKLMLMHNITSHNMRQHNNTIAKITQYKITTSHNTS